MKYSLIALAATSILSSSVSAHGHHHGRRHNHPDVAHFPAAASGDSVCECTTYVTSFLVDYTRNERTAPPPPPAAETGIPAVHTTVSPIGQTPAVGIPPVVQTSVSSVGGAPPPAGTPAVGVPSVQTTVSPVDKTPAIGVPPAQTVVSLVGTPAVGVSSVPTTVSPVDKTPAIGVPPPAQTTYAVSSAETPVVGVPPAQSTGSSVETPASGIPPVSTTVSPTGNTPAIGSQVTPSPSTVKSVVTVSPVPEPSSPEEELTTTQYSEVTATSTATNFFTVSMPYGNLPTPEITTLPTPGTYTIPAKTVTLTSTAVVCVPEHTLLTPGTHTVGGVTTIVETATTVICPVATIETSAGLTTTKIYQTTYVCPSGGTYTINPTTVTVTGTTTQDYEFPVPTEYPPGTYTQPEVITTITRTSQVVVCPFTSDTASLPVSTSPSSPGTSVSAPQPTTTPQPEPTTAPKPEPTTSPKTEPISSSAPPAVSSPPAPEISTTPLVPIVSSVISKIATLTSSSSEVPKPTGVKVTPGGGLWAITYSPYSNSGGCKTASEVDTDIADIASKGFQNVRLYSTDCSGLQNVGSSCEKHGVGIILGIFIKAGGVSTAADQVKDVIAWAKWELVVMFVVGNEAIFNGYVTAAELVAFITEVSGKVKQSGFKGPITTTEPLNILQANGAVLCGVMDVVGVNIHPFFNTQVTADKAGEFLASQLKLSEDVCGGKKVGWVLEAGWPSSGSPNGLAVPGKAEQATAIAGISKAAPGRVAFFTYTNDLWKSPGAFNVETNFGCASLF